VRYIETADRKGYFVKSKKPCRPAQRGGISASVISGKNIISKEKKRWGECKIKGRKGKDKDISGTKRENGK
jgi:hypothetical protein